MHTEVLLKERLDADLGGDYDAASADLRAGPAQELLPKEVLDTDDRGDYLAASAEIGR